MEENTEEKTPGKFRTFIQDYGWITLHFVLAATAGFFAATTGSHKLAFAFLLAGAGWLQAAMVGIDELRARRWSKSWKDLCMSETRRLLAEALRVFKNGIDKYEVEKKESKEASDGEKKEES